MDQQTHAQFLARYQEASDDQLRDFASKRNDLMEEAKGALDCVLGERGLKLTSISPAPLPPSRRVMTAAERTKEAEECSALWNGSLSKRIHFLFFAQALVFSGSLLGTGGLHAGALWVVMAAALLGWGMHVVGRRYTRGVCADDNRTIEEKRKSLKAASIVLWPCLLLSSLAGVILASLVRG